MKKISEYDYIFYHDFVTEVTTYVFGSEHPKETIEFTDLNFLRNRISIEKTDSQMIVEPLFYILILIPV